MAKVALEPSGGWDCPRKVGAFDASNRAARQVFVEWLAMHRRSLDSYTARFREWTNASRAAEAAAAAKAARPARPLAATFDIDEVLLCNLHLVGDPRDGWRAAPYLEGPDGRPWPAGSRASPPMAGAVELVREVVRCGARPYFVSRRHESCRAETVANLIAAGFVAPAPGAPLGGEDIDSGTLRLYDPTPEEAKDTSQRYYKEGVRREIEATHRIVANFGDQVSDLGEYGDNQCLLINPFYCTP
jgi:predicted secreted acid phosphatase